MSNKEMSELSKPVAWQYRYSSLGIVGEWKTVQDELLCNMRPEYERRPIFTAPPAVPDYKLNSPAIPDGWKLVPSEPTEEMVAAAMNCDDVEFNSDETFCVNFGNIYEAMLAAAPESTASHGLHQEQPSP